MESELRLNQTQLQQFMKCPEQHRRRWIEGDIIPPGRALVRGTAVHLGAEVNFRQKLESRRDLPAGDIVEAAVSSVGDRVRNEGLFLTEEELTKGKDAIVNSIEQEVRTLTGLYAEAVAPIYQPIAVEQEMGFKVEGLEGVQVYGRIDTISENHEVVDLKTYSKKANQAEMESDPQPTMYALLKLLKTGTPAKSVNLEILVNKKEPEHQRIQVTKTKADYVALLELVKGVAFAIRTGVVFGAYGQKGAWWCAKEQCGYWRTCKFVPAHKR